MAASLLVPATAFAATTPIGLPPVVGSTCHPHAGAACPMAVLPIPLITGDHVVAAHQAGLPTTSQCEATLGIACYDAAQLRKAYDLAPLYQRGITGAGRTIVIVDLYGSPTLVQDLRVFDKAENLPPADITVRHFDGSPTFDPTDPNQVSWAEETTLDVETAHTYAPGAHIEVVVPGEDTFDQTFQALQSVFTSGPADVVTMSFGADESDFYDPTDGYAYLQSLRYAFTYAASHNITLVSSTGDWGAGTVQGDGTLSTAPAITWPASDPDVVSVGGTSLKLNNAGVRTAPDTVWNDSFGASGGGLSVVFARPAYQDTVSSVVGDHRGVPDISMSSDPNGGEEVYWSIAPAVTGWTVVAGTSEASPTIAGVTALADQGAGHRLGNLNVPLYASAHQGGYSSRTGLVQVTKGDNSWNGVSGYPAGLGYNLATGIGTLNVADFVTALTRCGPRG
jgi:subtilase family serine protease